VFAFSKSLISISVGWLNLLGGGALALPRADINEFLRDYDLSWGDKPPKPPANYAYADKPFVVGFLREGTMGVESREFF